ncbi:MAG: methyltransferase [Pseudomonadota bacterium]
MTDDPLADAYNRGLAAEKAGNLDDAATAYGEVLRLDPADHGGAAIRLAAMGRGPVPDAAPEAYVATLFDQNAAAFDDMLVEQLGYAVPMLVRERLEALGLGPFPKLLDLGCGTGLTGASMTDLASDITGVDLSEQMLDEAHERGCYDSLYVGEAVAFLEDEEARADGPWDMISATDVLPYLGALERFFDGADQALNPGGLLVVSTETLPDQKLDGHDFLVGPKHRYGHARGYLERVLSASRFAVVDWQDIVVRYDEGQPVPGFLIAARSAV